MEKAAKAAFSGNGNGFSEPFSPLSCVNCFHGTGVDPQQVTYRTVFEHRGCQGNESEQPQQVNGGLKENEQRQDRQPDDGPDYPLGSGTDILCHG
jgi:hypothetical protein